MQIEWFRADSEKLLPSGFIAECPDADGDYPFRWGTAGC